MTNKQNGNQFFSSLPLELNSKHTLAVLCVQPKQNTNKTLIDSQKKVDYLLNKF
jgi:hypothetical protein